MTDWELITTTENQRVAYATHSTAYQFALCYPDWRTNITATEKERALLDYYYRQMCILYNINGTQYILGALIDYALTHPVFEVWFNGDKLP